MAPRYRGTRAAPVVIVGGGLTGCLAAYACGAAGIKAVLLEADRLGSGGSGRATGVVSPDPCSSYRDLEGRYGRRAARTMFEESRRARLDLQASTRRLRIKAQFEPSTGVRIVPPFASAADLQREVALRRAAGLEAVWLQPSQVTRDLALASEGGARFRDWALADPYRLLTGFADAARRRGVEIHERSAVRRIRVLRDGVEISTEGGQLTAGTVMVCTGEPGTLFRPLARHFVAGEEYAALTAVMPAPMRRAVGRRHAIIARADAPGDLIAFTPDDRILVTGDRQKPTAARGRDKVLVQRTGELMYRLLTSYPAISGLMPAFGWDVPAAVPPDGVMYAGPHRNFPRHLFAWGTSHDPARAWLASRILLRHYRGAAAKSDGWFAFTRGL